MKGLLQHEERVEREIDQQCPGPGSLPLLENEAPRQEDSQLPGPEQLKQYLSDMERDTGLTQAERRDQDGQALLATLAEMGDCLDPEELEQVVLVNLEALLSDQAVTLESVLSTERQEHLKRCEFCQMRVEAARLPPEKAKRLAPQLAQLAAARVAMVPTADGPQSSASGNWPAVVSLGLVVAGTLASASLAVLGWFGLI